MLQMLNAKSLNAIHMAHIWSPSLTIMLNLVQKMLISSFAKQSSQILSTLTTVSMATLTHKCSLLC